MEESEKESTAVALKTAEPFAIFRVDGAELRENLEANLGGKSLSPFKLDRVKIPAGGGTIWTVPALDGERSAKELQGIIVHHSTPRNYWRSQEPDGSPPDCLSDDGESGRGQRWDGDETALHDCLTCRLAVFGSSPKGGRGQACQQRHAVFLVQEDMNLPMLLLLPPTSLDPIDRYLYRLASRDIPPWGVVTVFTLKNDKNDDGQTFSRAVPQVAKRQDGSPWILGVAERRYLKEYREALLPSLRRARLEENE